MTPGREIMAGKPLSVSIECMENASTLVCRGELNGATAAKLEEAVDVAMRSEPEILYLDLRAIDSFAPEAVDVLLVAGLLCDKLGAELELLVNAEVLQVLDSADADALRKAILEVDLTPGHLPLRPVSEAEVQQEQ
jgi:anti-anti-sigma factor